MNENDSELCTNCEASPTFAQSDYCLHCGAEDSCWLVECECGNVLIWLNDEQLSYECPDCNRTSDRYVVTHFDSAYVINEILKRPDLHKKRTWIPASFVETLIRYVDSS